MGSWLANMRLLNTSRVATAGLMALVAINVVLVGLAVRSTNRSGIDTRPVSSAFASIDPLDAPALIPSTPSDKSDRKPSGTIARVMAVPLQTMLVAVDAKRAWRVEVGSCAAGGATLATTGDGGKTWVKGKPQLRRIVRVRPDDGRAAFVVGATKKCVAELRTTADSGGTWVATDYVGLAWFSDPTNPRVVHAPGPSTAQPCGKHAVVDLVVLLPDSARVLCADGLVRSTADLGSSWTTAAKVTGAVAMAVVSATPEQTYVARVGVPRCMGVEILRVDQKVATSCVPTNVPPAPGHIALSLVTGGGWLVVGDSTMRSTDSLRTWTVS